MAVMFYDRDADPDLTGGGSVCSGMDRRGTRTR